MSWPHILSLSRVLAGPIVAALILATPGDAFLAAALVFWLASITDLLDGKLARSSQRVSSLGVYVDTTSDKVMVSLVLIAMAIAGLAPAWIALTIVGREFLITGLRSYAASCNQVISSHIWGKGKAALTMVAIVMVLLADDGKAGGILARLASHDIWQATVTGTLWLLGVSAVLTVISGIRYVVDARSLLVADRVVTEPRPAEQRRMASGGERH